MNCPLIATIFAAVTSFLFLQRRMKAINDSGSIMATNSYYEFQLTDIINFISTNLIYFKWNFYLKNYQKY